MTTRPNIVFIVFDTARASAFEPWGSAPGTTPTITQLAARGSAPARAISTCNWTLPSHAAMFTGRLPRAVGLSDVPGAKVGACRPLFEVNRPRLLPEVLRRAGYRALGASANVWVGTSYGFDTGFDEFVDMRGHRHAGLTKHDWVTKLRWLYEALVANVDDGAEQALDIARRWVGDTSQPFFWFFNLIECHSPYLPPRPWNDLGPVQRVKATRDARRHLTLDAIWKATATRQPVPEDALERMRHLYGRAVTSMDAWLGRLLTLLDEHRVLDDTWVIVTSDHGENLGDGGLLGHAFSLDQRLIHVPLVVAGPDRMELPSFMSTVALPGLIGDMAGLAANPWTRYQQPAGDIAIAQYDAIVAPDDPRLDQVTRQWQLDAQGRKIFVTPMTAAVDGARKLVRYGDEFRLYNLDADPGEARPAVVADPAASAAADLFEAIRAADAADADPAMIAEIIGNADGEMDEALAEQMRLLGYL